MAATPIRLWSLQVPPTGEIVALEELGMPLNVSITMAAIDPTQEVKGDGPKLSTLRILHQNMSEPDIDDFDDDESIDSDLASGGEDEDDDDSEDDSEDDEEAEKEKNAKPKGKGANKKSVVVGKKQEDDEDEDDEEDDEDMVLDGLDSDDEDDYEDVVVCTLDPTKAYQQPLQLTIGDGEPVFFKASGAYTIYLTGNYVTEPRQLPPSFDDDDDEDEDLYSDDDDESIDEDDEYADILAKIKAGDFDEDSDDESDELDDVDNPRVTEIDDSDEEEAPALVSSKKPEENLSKKEKTAAAKAAQLKAKAAETAAKVISAKDKKRSADEMEIDSSATTEVLANGATVTTATATVTDTPPSSLSKKQQKKLKANSGEAVNVTPTEKKKVQFASQLEQGPTPNGNKSPAQPVEKAKAAEKDEKPTAQSSKTRVVDGVKIEDHKLGQGPEAKKGQKVGMRYIGKLTDGKVFDSNKKGKPFTFQLGKGEVIKGWDIGIAGMKVGGERKLVIPPNLAYGNKSLPGIPKNSTLVFEVKLLEIK